MADNNKVFHSFKEAFPNNTDNKNKTNNNSNKTKNDKSKKNSKKRSEKKKRQEIRRFIQRQEIQKKLSYRERSEDYEKVLDKRNELQSRIFSEMASTESFIKKPVKVQINHNDVERESNHIKEVQKNDNLKKSELLSVISEDNKNIIQKEVNNLTSLGYGISFEDFVVRGNKRYCAFNHDSVYIIARISILSRSGRVYDKDISAGYCPVCGCYYVTQNDFESLSEYGIPLCQQFTKEEFVLKNKGNGKYILKPHSVLGQMGYNVGQKDDLPKGQRQSILTLAMEKGIYTKAQIDSFLNWLISSREYNPSMDNAIERWREDRLFIKNYKKGDCKIVGVKSITGKLKAKLK